jgi:molybdopterin molybdotransferase
MILVIWCFLMSGPWRVAWAGRTGGGCVVRRVASSWKLIDEVLKEHASSTFRALRGPARPKAIEGLQELVGGKLPLDFIASLRVHDGMRGVNAAGPNFVNYKFLLPIANIQSEWRMLWDLQRECEFGGDQVTRTRKLKNDAHWRAGWIPVMDFNGDKLVLDLDPGPGGNRGQLFLWYNYGSTRMRVVADSFAGWLDALATELTSRRFTLDEWGSIHLRKLLA